MLNETKVDWRKQNESGLAPEKNVEITLGNDEIRVQKRLIECLSIPDPFMATPDVRNNTLTRAEVILCSQTQMLSILAVVAIVSLEPLWAVIPHDVVTQQLDQ